MPKYTEDDVQKAIDDVNSGVPKAVAARTHGVPRTTLLGRLHGSETRDIANEDNQKLSKDQEAYLVNWVTVQAKLGLPPTHLQIRQAAQRILAASGETEKLGVNWVMYFARRNPSIKALKGNSIEKERIEAVTREKVEEFFEILNESPVKEVRPANRWNMDETGIMEGTTASQNVYVPAGMKKSLR